MGAGGGRDSRLREGRGAGAWGMNPYRQPMRYPAQPPAVYTPSEGSENWDAPWVQMKYFTYQPAVYPRMLAGTSPKINAGGIVTVYKAIRAPGRVRVCHGLSTRAAET